MRNLINENVWSCDATFGVIGTREEIEDQLRITEGHIIREVDLYCEIDDDYRYLTDRYIVCGDSLDSIKEKALRMFCGIYINLLTEVPHSDIIVSTLVEEEDFFSLSDFEDFELVC